MTKTASRAAAKAYMEELCQKERDEEERKRILALIGIIGPFRNFLPKAGAPDDLHTKLDDWVGTDGRPDVSSCSAA